MTKTWTMRQLQQEIRGYSAALKARGLRENTIDTATRQASQFLRWLDGNYEPRGANALGRSRWNRPGRVTAQPGRIERSHGTPGPLGIASVSAIEPFDLRSPSGGVEHFARGWSFDVRSGVVSHHVRHALTAREAFGRLRARSVTFVDGRATVEGVETDTYSDDGALFSLLKINGRKHVMTRSEIPAGYQSFEIVSLGDVVAANANAKGLGVRIKEDDLDKWARHALLRARSRGR